LFIIFYFKKFVYVLNFKVNGLFPAPVFISFIFVSLTLSLRVGLWYCLWFF